MSKMKVDRDFCDRFIDALKIYFSDERERLIQYKVAKLLSIKESVISDIKRGRQEPSKKTINKVLVKCEMIDPLWLLTGKIDKDICKKIHTAIYSLKINLEELSKTFGVSTRFVISILNYQITPSSYFIKRFSQIYNADEFIYGKIDKNITEWLEKIIITKKLRANEIAKRLGVSTEFILSIINGEAVFPKHLIQKFCEEYKVYPKDNDLKLPRLENNKVKEIIKILKNDNQAQDLILKLLRSRKESREATQALTSPKTNKDK